MNLLHGFQFHDLYDEEKLCELDKIFINGLPEKISKSLKESRNNKPSSKEESKKILEISPFLEKFIIDFFSINSEFEALKENQNNLLLIHEIKRNFIQKKIARKFDITLLDNLNFNEIKGKIEKILFPKPISDLNLAKQIKKSQISKNTEELNLLENYVAFIFFKEKPNRTLFNIPQKINQDDLIKQFASKDQNDILEYKGKTHLREGFQLSDHGADLEFVMDQTGYCIFCHHQEKDSCSKGSKNLDVIGCPLEEKISEMNELKFRNNPLASLAVAIIDNPMIAATGHRICNDCMKSCIYQKQDPVDVPQVETRILKDILSLPYGFEIYSLLTRWNPLNFTNPLPKKNTNRKIMVAGMGPAGFTLSHYLLNEGHVIVGIDGLKIEPTNVKFEPIKWVRDIKEDLNNRNHTGFGGVAEYGITIRWDKNFLKMIRILLERRKNFRLFDGIRIGSNITYDQAFKHGFEHIALCTGAGKPTILNMPNSLARGVRTASDFLMSLQLTKPFSMSSISNLQIRMPIIVIGGGLTAIDAATEALAYYPVQVDKFTKRVERIGKKEFFKTLTAEEQMIATEFLTHAKELSASKDKISLLKKWGGVKILYRKNFKDSPSYKLNHEELILALKEGIEFIDNATSTEFIVDAFKHLSSIKFKRNAQIEELSAKTLLIAAGTSPNITAKQEFPHKFEIDGKYFKAFNEKLEKITPEQHCKTNNLAMLTTFNGENNISFFGDLHPSFAGNVVKAMASAKRGHHIISNILKRTPENLETADAFFNKMEDLLVSRIHQINRLGENIIELVIKSKLAASNFKPGQFYRLQNYENSAPRTSNLVFASEPLALTGTSKDETNGLISTIILEMGGSSNVCAFLKEKEKIVLMGPTGTPTKIRKNSKIMLIGGGLGNAVLFSIGKALQESGSEIVYFAAYKKTSDIFKMEEIEKSSNNIIWCCDEKEITPNRSCDESFHGNVVDAIKLYANNKFKKVSVEISDIDEMIVIGSDGMMNAVNELRKSELLQKLKKDHKATASINSPMQCMMKEICAQCLQQHIDPETGLESYVYSCVNQDQCMRSVNFLHLNERLKQNSLHEKLTKELIKIEMEQLK